MPVMSLVERYCRLLTLFPASSGVTAVVVRWVGCAASDVALKARWMKTAWLDGTSQGVAAVTFGQVPYIDDDGFILYESRAICRYLNKKYPGSELTPTPGDIKAEALFDQAWSVETSHFHAAMLKLVTFVVFYPFYGRTVEPEALAEAQKELEAKLDVYETILSKQKYIAGDKLSLVDLFHLSHGPLLTRYADIRVMYDEKRPNVLRWWKEITAYPEWVRLEKQEAIKSILSY
ncbi:Glutathione S-transferase [Mycena indigotica]|uniref:glutathione transferase n=1 Tax=Mycena indigotica TaxID=2126181 RepID=A0A8H6SB60_9AGAR|nr:Glutathione S-transferase [Mycena indigotica]KAF7295703.1 Glutathione S-transferase [Mycena indigotica]